MCDASVVLGTATSPHPEAPEMLSIPVGVRVGFVKGDHAPEIIVCCSEECLKLLFVE